MPRDTIENLNPRNRRESDADKLIVAFAESRGHLGRVRNVRLTWPRFCDRLETPRVDNLTYKEYKALPISEQHSRKNEGYFVGGQFDKGIRKSGNIKERSLLTFDIDRCSPEMLAELRVPFDLILSEYEYLIHSTRNHTDETPRIRLIVPLAKPIDVEKYTPLLRILSWHIDNAMTTVDPVSFSPVQVMYWPSVCKDSTYVFKRHPGRLLDADAILNEWGEWTNYNLLPVSPREDKARKAAQKATDPRTKHGVIGAWCRVYSVYEVIEKFLGDKYVPGEQEDRYTFLEGSTANGAVIYDEGLFLYSHHGTDPCSGRLVNGFDLLRIHKFGHLDKPEDLERDDVTSLPSYKAMIRFAEDDELVREELAKDHLPDEEYIADFDADADDAIPPAREREPAAEVTTEPSKEWMKELEKDRNGQPLSTLPNVRTILRHDHRIKGSLAYNELQEQPVLLRRIKSKEFSDTRVRDRIQGDNLTEDIYVTIRLILETPSTHGGYGLKVNERDLKDGIHAVVMHHRFHPVQRYLRSLVWDGVPRIRRLFQDYFHAEERPFYSAFSFNFMVGAAMRAFEPGAKFDFVPILQGPQGCGKSSGIRILAGEAFFGEINADFSKQKEVLEQLQGRWIGEIPELSQFNKGAVETIKAVISAQQDRARLAYLRGARNYLRQTVLMGTTNRQTFLKDPTGNRRFWPIVLVPGKRVEFAKLIQDRDQLWAEAYREYLHLRFDHDGDLPLYIGKEHDAEVQAAQGEHSEIDETETLANAIYEWLEQEVTPEEARIGYRGGHDTDDLWHGDATGEPKHVERVKRTETCVADIAYHVLNKTDFDARADKTIPRALERVPGWKRAKQQRIRGLGSPTIWKRV